VERLADVVMLGLGIGILLLQLSLPPWARRSGQVALATSAVALLFAVVLGTSGMTIVRALERPLSILPARFRPFVVRQSEVALAELAALGQWQSGATIWALSALL